MAQSYVGFKQSATFSVILLILNPRIPKYPSQSSNILFEHIKIVFGDHKLSEDFAIKRHSEVTPNLEKYLLRVKIDFNLPCNPLKRM